MTKEYDESTILKITPHEHVRLRPGMYFNGGKNLYGLYDYLRQYLDNAIEYAFKNHARTITVTWHDHHTITIEDDGVGLPTEIYPEAGQTRLEILLTRSGYFDVNGKYVNTFFGSAWHYLNAASAKMDVVVKRNGLVWEANYQSGLPIQDVRITRDLNHGESTGTKITFSPDFEIFEKNDFEAERIARRLRELSFLYQRITFIFITPLDAPKIYVSQNGVADYVSLLNQSKTPLHPPIHIKISVTKKEEEPYHLHIGFQYVDDNSSLMISYANTIETFGGTHQDAFLDALNSCMPFDTQLYDITRGLVAVISIFHPSPQFESQMRMRFINEIDERYDDRNIFDELKKYYEFHPDVFEIIHQKCLANYHYHRARKFGE